MSFRAVAIAAGQTISLTTIIDNLALQAPEISPAAVVAAGAVNLLAVAPSSAALEILRSLWNLAISRTMIFSYAAVTAAIPFTLGMEWLNAKKISAERKEAAERLKLASQSSSNYSEESLARSEEQVGIAVTTETKVETV